MNGRFAGFVGLHLVDQLTVGDLVVGCGTVLLALLTYFVVRVARHTLVAHDAPLVIGANVPSDTEIASRFQGFAFDPPFAGLLPDGYSPSFVMRLWNVGRGPGVVQDTRLDLGHGDALGPMPSHAVVHAGQVRDESWLDLSLPTDEKDSRYVGRLRIIYAHPNRQLFETISAVELSQRRLYGRTIRRRRSRWWRRGYRPRVFTTAGPNTGPDRAGGRGPDTALIPKLIRGWREPTGGRHH